MDIRSLPEAAEVVLRRRSSGMSVSGLSRISHTQEEKVRTAEATEDFSRPEAWLGGQARKRRSSSEIRRPRMRVALHSK